MDYNFSDFSYVNRKAQIHSILSLYGLLVKLRILNKPNHPNYNDIAVFLDKFSIPP